MTPDTRSRDLLTRAFAGFERAAANLELGQSSLRDEIVRLERELIDANRRLEAVLDAVSPGVAVLADNGDVVRSNRAFQTMDLADIARVTWPEGLPSGADGGAARVRRPGHHGERDLALTLVSVGDEESSRVLTVQDVTDIRREEEQGGRRRRLEAMGRMAAELAHEVRNPLGSIRLFASMLRDDLAGQDSLREMAEQILAGSSNLEATVTNLLAFAAPSRAKKRRTDLCAIVADALALLAPVCAARDVRLECPAGDGECAAWADPEGLRQVVLNLLGNALAATGSGGAIRVRTGTDGRHVTLEVEDDGCGVAPEDLPRVFDPFFSRTEGGTGLGLSVVHGVVERHGGRIALDSTPRRGTRVRIEFPCEASEEDTDA